MVRPGPVPAPRRTLHPRFRAAVRAPGRHLTSLAAAAHIPHKSGLSRLLHAPAVCATPLNLTRLMQIAQLIGYSDDIFVGAEPRDQQAVS